MFFMNKEAMNGGSKGRDKMNSRGGSEQLAIFGNKRARRGAELKAPKEDANRNRNRRRV